MSVTHATLPAGKVRKAQLQSLVHEFSGGAQGSLPYRDTGASDGKSWLAAAPGVLTCAGAGQVPAWSTTPTLTGTNFSGIPASAIGSGALAVARGGTGLASYAIGDLLYASGATTLAKLADVAVGQVLVSGGVGAAPAWSTSPTLSGGLTVGGVEQFLVNASGHVGIGAAPATEYQFLIDGTFDSATHANAQDSMKIRPHIKPVIGGGAAGISLVPSFTIAASGVNPNFSTLQLSTPTINPSSGSGTLTNAAIIFISGAAVSGGVNNYVVKSIPNGAIEWGGINNMSLGGAVSPGTQFYLRGTYPAFSIAQEIATRLQPGTGTSGAGLYVGPTIDIGAGSHTHFAGAWFAVPTLTAGAGSVTNATTVKIDGAPTGGNTNRALWVVAGLAEFNGTMKASGLGAFVAGDKYVTIDASGNLHVSAVGPAS